MFLYASRAVFFAIFTIFFHGGLGVVLDVPHHAEYFQFSSPFGRENLGRPLQHTVKKYRESHRKIPSLRLVEEKLLQLVGRRTVVSDLVRNVLSRFVIAGLTRNPCRRVVIPEKAGIQSA